MSKDDFSVDSNEKKEPDASDKSGKNWLDLLKSLAKRFLEPTWLVSTVFAILIGYFGINYQKCSQDLEVTQDLEVIIDTPFENRTINYSLEDKESVENGGGIVHGGYFDEGGCGSRGFISVENRDVIFFPIPPKFTSLYEGTVAFCVTPKGPLRDSFSLFRVHEVQEKDPNISLKVVSNADGQQSRFRLRGHTRAEKEVVLSEEFLDWETNDHYHIAATWGPIGMRLYINGKLRGEGRAVEDIISNPIDFKDGTFVINNFSPELDECYSPTNCIISNLQVSNYQLSEEEIKRSYSKLHPEK